MGPNSDTQNAIYNIINNAPYSLSLEEIVTAVGRPKNTVRGSLTKLRKRGLVDLGVAGWRRVVS